MKKFTLLPASRSAAEPLSPKRVTKVEVSIVPREGTAELRKRGPPQPRGCPGICACEISGLVCYIRFLDTFF